MNLKSFIRDISDFPKKGIIFKDISPLLANSSAFKFVIDSFCDKVNGNINKIAVIDARGFIFGSPIAYKLGLPLVLLRKSGKLPGRISSFEYKLEYGVNTLEIQDGLIEKGDNVLLIDDVLATGGTAIAGKNLIQQSGGKVSQIFFLIELLFLHGKDKLGNCVFSLLQY